MLTSLALAWQARQLVDADADLLPALEKIQQEVPELDTGVPVIEESAADVPQVDVESPASDVPVVE